MKIHTSLQNQTTQENTSKILKETDGIERNFCRLSLLEDILPSIPKTLERPDNTLGNNCLGGALLETAEEEWTPSEAGRFIQEAWSYLEKHRLFSENMPPSTIFQAAADVAQPVGDNLSPRERAACVRKTLENLSIGQSYTIDSTWKIQPFQERAQLLQHGALVRIEKITSNTFDLYVYQLSPPSNEGQWSIQDFQKNSVSPCVRFSAVSLENLAPKKPETNPSSLLIIEKLYGLSHTPLENSFSLLHIFSPLPSTTPVHHLTFGTPKAENYSIKIFRGLILERMGNKEEYKRVTLDLRLFAILHSFQGWQLQPTDRTGFLLQQALMSFLNHLDEYRETHPSLISDRAYMVAVATGKEMLISVNHHLNKKKTAPPIPPHQVNYAEAAQRSSYLNGYLPENPQKGLSNRNVTSGVDPAIGKNSSWEALGKCFIDVKSQICLQDPFTCTLQYEALMRNLAHLKSREFPASFNDLTSIQQHLATLENYLQIYCVSLKQLNQVGGPTPRQQNALMETIAIAYQLAVKADQLRTIGSKPGVLASYGIDTTFFCKVETLPFFHIDDLDTLKNRKELISFFLSRSSKNKELFKCFESDYTIADVISGKYPEAGYHLDTQPFLKSDTPSPMLSLEEAQKKRDDNIETLGNYCANLKAYSEDPFQHFYRLKTITFQVHALLGQCLDECINTDDRPSWGQSLISFDSLHNKDQRPRIFSSANVFNWGNCYEWMCFKTLAIEKFDPRLKKTLGPWVEEYVKAFHFDKSFENTFTRFPENILRFNRTKGKHHLDSWAEALSVKQAQISTLLQDLTANLTEFSSDTLKEFSLFFYKTFASDISSGGNTPLIEHIQEDPLLLERVHLLGRQAHKLWKDDPAQEESLRLILQLQAQILSQYQKLKPGDLPEKLTTLVYKQSRWLQQVSTKKQAVDGDGYFAYELTQAALLMAIPFSQLPLDKKGNLFFGMLNIQQQKSSTSQPKQLLFTLLHNYLDLENQLEAEGESLSHKILQKIDPSLQIVKIEKGDRPSIFLITDQNATKWQIDLLSCQLTNSQGVRYGSCPPSLNLAGLEHLSIDLPLDYQFLGDSILFEHPLWGKLQAYPDSEKTLLRRFFDSRWYTYIPPEQLHHQELQLNQALRAHCAAWIDPVTKKLILTDLQGNTQCETTQEGELVSAPGGNLFIRSGYPDSLTRFESPEQICSWKDPKGNFYYTLPQFSSKPLFSHPNSLERRLVYLDNPSFYVDETPEQPDWGILHYLNLCSTDQKSRRVLIPLSFRNNKKHLYFEYEVKEGELQGKTLNEKLYLTQIHLSQKQYQKALKAIKEISISDTPNQESWEILAGIFNLKTTEKDNSSKAQAIRLHAYLQIRAINPGEKILEKFMKPLVDIYSYYMKTPRVRETGLPLSEEEETLIREAIPCELPLLAQKNTPPPEKAPPYPAWTRPLETASNPTVSAGAAPTQSPQEVHQAHYQKDQAVARAQVEKNPRLDPHLSREELQETLAKQITLCLDEEALIEAQITALVSRPDPDPIKHAHHFIRTQGRAKERVSIEAVCRAASSMRNSLERLKKLNPTLSQEEITQLQKNALLWMKLQTRRGYFKEILSKLEGSCPDTELAELLDKKRLYKADQEPFFLFFEWRSGIRMRQVQKELIEKAMRATHHDRSLIFQLIMAGGKSSVIFSALLETISECTNFVPCVIAHHSQYAATLSNLKSFHNHRFKKELIPIDATLAELNDPNFVNTLIRRFDHAKKTRAAVLTSSSFPLTLQIKIFLESLEYSSSQTEAIPESLTHLCELRQKMEQTVFLLDEIDTSLSMKIDVRAPYGKSHPFPADESALLSAVYEHLATNKELAERVPLLENNQETLSEEDYHKEILPKLAEFLFQFPPLRLSTKPQFKNAFIRYMTNQIPLKDLQNEAELDKIPDETTRENVALLRLLNYRIQKGTPLDKRSAELIGTARHFVRKILPLTLSRNYFRNYGPKLDQADEGEVVPYKGTGTPAHTKFGTPHLALAYHLQACFRQPISPDEIRFLGNKMVEAAKLYANSEKQPLEKTLEASQFLAMTGIKLSDIEKPEALEQAYRYVNDPQYFARKLAIRAEVAPFYVRANPQEVYATGIDLVAVTPRNIGGSGTLHNHHAFNIRLQNPQLDEGTEGKVLNQVLLNGSKKNTLATIKEKSLDSLIEMMSQTPAAEKKQIGGLIDIAGFLKSEPDLNAAAKKLQIHFNNNPDYQKKAVVYLHKFGPNNEQFVLLSHHATDPIPLGNTTKEEILKHKIPLENIFFIWDELRTTGTDFPLPGTQENPTRCYATLDPKIPLRNMLQGYMRARDYLNSLQEIYAVIRSLELPLFQNQGATIRDILDTLISNEAAGIGAETTRSYQEQLTSILKQEALNAIQQAVLYNKPATLKAAVAAYTSYIAPQKNYFNYPDWLAIEVDTSTRDALRTLHKEALESSPTTASKREEVLAAMDKSAYLLPTIPKNGLQNPLDNEIEVEQEYQIEIEHHQEALQEKELDIELNLFQLGLQCKSPAQETDWTKEWTAELPPTLLSVPDFLKEHNPTIKGSSEKFASCFVDNIWITQNLRQPYKDQTTPVFSKDFKETHFALIVRDSKGELQTILLSKQDKQYAQEHLKETGRKDAWLFNLQGFPEIEHTSPLPTPEELQKPLWYANFFNGNAHYILEHAALTEELTEGKRDPHFGQYLLLKNHKKRPLGVMQTILSGLAKEKQIQQVSNKHLFSYRRKAQIAAKEQYQILTPAQIQALKNYEVKYLDQEQVAYITPAQVPFLENAQLPFITDKQFKNLSPSQRCALPQERLNQAAPAVKAAFIQQFNADFDPQKPLQPWHFPLLTKANIAKVPAHALREAYPPTPLTLRSTLVGTIRFGITTPLIALEFLYNFASLALLSVKAVCYPRARAGWRTQVVKTFWHAPKARILRAYGRHP